jgi:hypothetical protein
MLDDVGENSCSSTDVSFDFSTQESPNWMDALLSGSSEREKTLKCAEVSILSILDENHSQSWAGL